MSGWDQFVASNDSMAVGAVALGIVGIVVLVGKRLRRHQPRRGPRGGIFGSRIQALLVAIVFVLVLMGGLGEAAEQGDLPAEGPSLTGEVAP